MTTTKMLEYLMIDKILKRKNISEFERATLKDRLIELQDEFIKEQTALTPFKNPVKDSKHG